LANNSSVSLHTGDVLETLRTFESNTFDAVLSDPPYALGFMNSDWDKSIPDSTVWGEVLRTLKPGAPLLAFGGTRTFHRLTVAIEDAGFEIRDCLLWMHAQGFPKAKTALKPAWEPIGLAMKPLAGTYAQNAATYGVSGLNIESSRTDEGRWPANLILHESFNQPWSRFFYCPKASTAEREAGCESLPLRISGGMSGTADQSLKTGSGNTRNNLRRNCHPTVKPVALNKYLAGLILPPQRESSPRRLLVPYCGSGSEAIGALLAGWESVTGIERDPEFVEIAAARIEHWSKKQLCQ
jgi:site-specific DNA-methyltransferase (adenine-specific)